MTFEINDKVWLWATKTKQTYKLASEFAPGDMIAVEADYHLHNLAKLYRDARNCV